MKPSPPAKVQRQPETMNRPVSPRVVRLGEKCDQRNNACSRSATNSCSSPCSVHTAIRSVRSPSARMAIGAGFYPDQPCPGQSHLCLISTSVTLLENDFGVQAAGLGQATKRLIIAPSDAGRRGDRDRGRCPRRDHGRGNSKQAGEPRSRFLLQLGHGDKVSRRLGHRCDDLRRND